MLRARLLPIALVLVTFLVANPTRTAALDCPPGQQAALITSSKACAMDADLSITMVAKVECRTTSYQCRRVTTQADREAAMTARAVRWATCAVQILGRPSPADSGNPRPQTNARRAAATASGASNGTR